MNIEDWTEERISEVKDKEAADFIRMVVNSPYIDGYLAVRATIDNINSELQGGAITIMSEAVQLTNGKFEVKDKAFERGHKFITEIQSYYDQLEYFRKHLPPQEIQDIEDRAIDLIDEARLNLKKKNGKVSR